jgi:hypothetical protein
MSQEKTKDMSQYFYRASAADFMKIPGNPVAYWTSERVFEIFSTEDSLKNTLQPKQGTSTGNDELFVRFWHEVSFREIGFGLESITKALESDYIYFPLNKGGEFRRWYGNNEKIIKFGLGAYEELLELGNHLPSRNQYFKRGLTWSKITSNKISVRYDDVGFVFSSVGLKGFPKDEDIYCCLGFMNSLLVENLTKILSPTLSIISGDIEKLPYINISSLPKLNEIIERLVDVSRMDWDSFERSWDFATLPMISENFRQAELRLNYQSLRAEWQSRTEEVRDLERENNTLFNEAYGLEDELKCDVSVEEVTLDCNPQYRYGGNRSEEEQEALLQCDTLRELVSYAIGCMMGRYSIEKPGLILASQGETLQDYLSQIPSPRFMPDDDAILPLTDQEWFADDATNRFREFVRVVWGDEHLQENLDFVAESLCLHAIKPKRGESALDTIRRYLSTQFYKDHMRTYKKRPIYWLFSSGKHKAFECLVYLHRYNEGTLARMRTEYVIPLTAKLTAYADKLEQDKAASASAAETKRLEKEISTLHKQQAELAEFDEKLRHFADQRIALDLDDGVKVNYGKFGDLLAEVKVVTGVK